MKYIKLLLLFIGFNAFGNTETDNDKFSSMLAQATAISNVCMQNESLNRCWQNVDTFIKTKTDLIPAATDLIMIDHLIALGLTKRKWQYKYAGVPVRAMQASVVNIMLRRFKNANGYEYIQGN